MRGESCDRYQGWGSVFKEIGSDQTTGAASHYRLACLSAVNCRLALFCLCNHCTCSTIHLCLCLLFQRPLTEFHSVVRVDSIQYKQELWLCGLKDTSFRYDVQLFYLPLLHWDISVLISMANIWIMLVYLQQFLLFCQYVFISLLFVFFEFVN